MNRKLLATSLIIAVLSGINSARAQSSKPEQTPDVVVNWNLITVNATKTVSLNSNLSTRIEAIEAIAVYDAINSIKHFGTPYHYYSAATGQASAQAAAAYAAYAVLVNYFPSQKPSLNNELEKSLGRITDGPIGTAQTVGYAAAADIIALRANDGSSPLTTYAGKEKPGAGEYRSTPGKFAPAIDVEWGGVKPFILTDAKQFLPKPPPALQSDEYKNALAEVAELGELNSKKRTEDQTHIAQFYKQDAELTVNEGARALAISHRTSLEKNALVFVLVDIAEADARIEVWGGKYNYLFWRPVTALNATSDGSVNDYNKWAPLLTTPPHPSYPSGHSATVTAGYEILKKFFGDKNLLELHTTSPGEAPRSIESLSKVEYENGYSRVYGGIHYPFENTTAQNIGRQVANYTLEKGPKAIKN